MERRNFWGKSPLDKELKKLAKFASNNPNRVIRFGGCFYEFELEKINEFLRYFPDDNFYIVHHGQAILAHKVDRTTYIIKF